jgi:spore maturation protein CgeB
MRQQLRLRFFAHSWISDWNHGNAHFLRGLASELVRLGQDVRCYEQMGSWSAAKLLSEEGERGSDAIQQFRDKFADLDVRFYQNDSSFCSFAEDELRSADIIVIHEWSPPQIVNTILGLKQKLGFRVLLHDTHHRAYSNPQEIRRFDLRRLDGVLAFGEAVRRIYTDGFGVHRAWTFHEAADTRNFHPCDNEKNTDVVWVGNWGDEERSRELEEFLIRPASALHPRKVVVHGVRYPDDARENLQAAGIEFRGYLPNLCAPAAYSRSLVTLHVSRRQYANGLSGIPTIRVFEAMACGIPLLCAPWTDIEGLFRLGEDYLCLPDERAMEAELKHLLMDDAARAQMATNALETIRNRHTCAHRAQQLLDICQELGT